MEITELKIVMETLSLTILQELKALRHELQTIKGNDIELSTLSVSETLQMLNISRTTFEKYKRQGLITSTKVLGKIHVDRKCVEKLKESTVIKQQK